MKSREEIETPVVPQRPRPALGTPAKRQSASSPEKSGEGCYHPRLLLRNLVGRDIRKPQEVKKKSENLLD